MATIDALVPQLADRQIMGAVTAIVRASGADPSIECVGHAGEGRAMASDTLFRIASMSKPITGAAVLMLQDEGRLNLSDPVAKHVPELGALRTPAGEPAGVTLLQMLTHTSGMGEGELPPGASSLAELVPAWSAAEMRFAPGEKWSYCQSALSTRAAGWWKWSRDCRSMPSCSSGCSRRLEWLTLHSTRLRRS